MRYSEAGSISHGSVVTLLWCDGIFNDHQINCKFTAEYLAKIIVKIGQF